jgi:DNA-binding response OmpR family regulator
MSKILVVEDDKTLREVYATILKFSNYNAETASNGRVALDMCKENHYDVILLDLMMPILDGVGFLKQARLKETSPGTKVIIFSNLSSGSLIEEALRLGVDDHVLKSHLTPHELVELVKRYGA